MKKQKVAICILVLTLVISAFILSACGPILSDATLYDTGLEMTSLMGEMVENSTYLEMVGIQYPGNATDLCADDYDTPIKTYVIDVPSNKKILELVKADRLEEVQAMPQNLREQLYNIATFDAVITDVILEHTELTESYIYLNVHAHKQLQGTITKDVAFLYIFEKGKPIIVYYHQLAKNTVSIMSRFVGDNIYSTLSDTREVFKQYGCTVTEYK